MAPKPAKKSTGKKAPVKKAMSVRKPAPRYKATPEGVSDRQHLADVRRVAPH
jgi:hypothetical protein